MSQDNEYVCNELYYTYQCYMDTQCFHFVHNIPGG